MLDFDAGKLLIIGVVALVVIGPKDLPRVLRQAGQAIGKLRRMAGEFQGQFMEAMREADLQDLQQEVAKLKDTASLDVHFDPARDIQRELTGAVDSLGASPSPVVSDILTATPALPHGGQGPAADTALAPSGTADVAVLPEPAEAVAAAPLEAAVLAEPGPSLAAAAEAVHVTREVSAPAGVGTDASAPSAKRKIIVSRRAGGGRFMPASNGLPLFQRRGALLPARRGTTRT